MRQKYKGLDLTEQELAAVEKWFAWREAKRMASRKAPFYAEIDRRFKDIDPATREELADDMYRQQMREFALKRSQPQRAE